MRDSSRREEGEGELVTEEERRGLCDTALPHAPEKDEGVSEDSGAPDGGWGWCVVVGATLCAMILATQGPCFGILYGQRLRELGATPILAAWLFNFQSLVWNLTGPLAGPLSSKFSYRSVAMTAALTAVSSLFFSALVGNPYLMLLTFSTLNGAGGGITINCCYQLINKYFRKKLGLANGIMVSGGSVGLMLLPQLASRLQERYPFQWATFITGAVMLHVLVGCLLFHPIRWHYKPPKTLEQLYLSPDDTRCVILEDESESSINDLPSTQVTGRSMPRRFSEPHNLMKQGRSPLLPDTLSSSRFRTTSLARYPINGSGTVDQQDTKKRSVFELGGSSMMGSVLTLPEDHHPDKVGDERAGAWEKIKAHFSLSVLRDPLAVSVALVTCLSITTAINIFAAMPFVLNDAGYSLQEAAVAMSSAAVADLVTRLVGTAVADLPQVNLRVIYFVAQLIFVVSPIVLLCARENWWLVLACMCSFGIGLGIMYLLDVLIIVRLLGPHRLHSVFGISQLFRCVAFIVVGPVGGVLRESTGSYLVPLIFYSVVLMSAILLMAVTALITRCSTPASTSTRTTRE